MVSALVLHINFLNPFNGCFIYFQKTLQKYISGKQVKEGWVLSVPYDAKHGVGTPYLKPSEGSSSTKGNRTIKRQMIDFFLMVASCIVLNLKMLLLDYMLVQLTQVGSVQNLCQISFKEHYHYIVQYQTEVTYQKNQHGMCFWNVPVSVPWHSLGVPRNFWNAKQNAF